MSRTTRKNTFNKCSLRNPHTFNEKRNVDSFLTDVELLEEYPVSKVNRIRSRRNLPTHWDDVVTSSYYEIYRGN